MSEENIENNSIPSDETMIEIGNGVKVSFGELKSGGLRQADYTKKTMELADKKKGIEEDIEDFDKAKVYIENINGYFKENPKEYNKMAKFFDGEEIQIEDKGGDGEEEKKPKEKPLRSVEYDRKMDSQQKQIDAINKNNRDKDVTSAINKVKKEQKPKGRELEIAISLTNSNFDNSISIEENITKNLEVVRDEINERVSSAEEVFKQKIATQPFANNKQLTKTDQSDVDQLFDGITEDSILDL